MEGKVLSDVPAPTLNQVALTLTVLGATIFAARLVEITAMHLGLGIIFLGGLIWLRPFLRLKGITRFQLQTHIRLSGTYAARQQLVA